MLTNKVLIAFFVGTFLTACGDDSSTSAKTESATETASAPPTPVQKKEPDKIDEAIFALKFFSAAERDKAALEATRIFGEIQMKAAGLEGKADAAALMGLKRTRCGGKLPTPTPKYCSTTSAPTTRFLLPSLSNSASLSPVTYRISSGRPIGYTQGRPGCAVPMTEPH
jgi:hypothetical protein